MIPDVYRHEDIPRQTSLNGINMYTKFVSYANILSAAFTINMLNAPPLFL